MCYNWLYQKLVVICCSDLRWHSCKFRPAGTDFSDHYDATWTHNQVTSSFMITLIYFLCILYFYEIFEKILHLIQPGYSNCSNWSENISKPCNISFTVVINIFCPSTIDYSTNPLCPKWWLLTLYLWYLNFLVLSVLLLGAPLCLHLSSLTSVNSASCAYCGKILQRWRWTIVSTKFSCWHTLQAYSEQTGGVHTHTKTQTNTQRDASMTGDPSQWRRGGGAFLEWKDPSLTGKSRNCRREWRLRRENENVWEVEVIRGAEPCQWGW